MVSHQALQLQYKYKLISFFHSNCIISNQRNKKKSRLVRWNRNVSEQSLLSHDDTNKNENVRNYESYLLSVFLENQKIVENVVRILQHTAPASTSYCIISITLTFLPRLSCCFS